jgi:hypothetical protein
MIGRRRSVVDALVDVGSPDGDGATDAIDGDGVGAADAGGVALAAELAVGAGVAAGA